jgi:hypothetical protein
METPQTRANVRFWGQSTTMKQGAAEFHFSVHACVVRFDHESEDGR